MSHLEPRRPLRCGIIVLALALLLLAPASVAAADLDMGEAVDVPPSLPQQTVSFGSGWYVRGDVSGTDFPGLTPSQAALGSAPTISFLSKSNLGFSASLGGGYAFTNNIRVDIVGDYHQALHGTATGTSFNCPNGYTTTQPLLGYADGLPVYGTSQAQLTYGTCQGSYDAKLNSYDVLVNAYYDIGTWYGITPYVGAGVGLSFGHYSTSATYTQYDQSSYNVTLTDPVSNNSYHYDFDRTSSGQYYNLAWALMAGFAYDLTSHAKLDIGYRYLNLGTILDSRYALQEGHVGVRYMIDN